MSQRTLQFRAWDGKEMVQTFCITSNGCIRKHLIGLPFQDLDHYIVMQFTGLHDKNGKEIWEGDVVSICGHKDPKMYGVIKWDHCGFVIEWTKENIRRKMLEIEKEPIFHNCNISLEVIGNVYENPELIGA